MKEIIIEKIKQTKVYPILKSFLFQKKERNYKNDYLNQEECNEYFKHLLLGDDPCMVARFGSTELSLMKAKLTNKPYSNKEKSIAINNAGIFPSDNKTLDFMVNEYLKSCVDIDLLGIWFNPYEDQVANNHCINSKITILRNLEPYFSAEPWSKYLEHKTVLVVHPFSQSIETQYKKRELLFKDENVLPDFYLISYPAIQSIGGNENFSSWVEALEKMKDDIAKIDFDIAIIGAGAYGLPLASHVKNIGKKAIHLGGATQMLFGVYGQRWAIHPDFQDIINEHWVKPTPNETPKTARNVENACYW